MLKRLATGIATTSLFLSAVIPAFASTPSVEISSNGVGSYNKVEATQKCSQYVSQANNLVVGIDLSVSGNSGKNVASGNTGGDVSVDTGDVTNGVALGVAGGSNTAVVPECCCGDQAYVGGVVVSENGAWTTNKVDLYKKSDSKLKQKSYQYVEVEGKVKGNSGKNKSKWNTGSGVEFKTGTVENAVEVFVGGGNNDLN